MRIFPRIEHQYVSIVIVILSICAFTFVFSNAHARPALDKRELNLELEEVDGAIEYEIEVRPVDRSANEKRFTFKSPKPKFKLQLRPGHFEMRLRAADDRGIYGGWSDPSEFSVSPKQVEQGAPVNGAKILARENEEIEFHWNEAPGALGYRVVIKSEDGKAEREEDVSAPPLKLKLTPGKNYRWHVLSRYEKELFSEPPEEGSPLFTYVGSTLTQPKIGAHTLEGLDWQTPEPAKSVDYVLTDTNVPAQEIEKAKGTLTANARINYQLDERRLYRLTVVAHAPLHESSKVRTVYFERQGKELIIYGDQRPSDSDRLASKERRWFVAVRRSSHSFYGENQQFGTRTSFEGSGGLNLKAGVVQKGSSWDHRMDANYSYIAASSTAGEVVGSLIQVNMSALWRRNLAFKKVPLHLAFGASYDEIPEFVGNSSGVLALQYLRLFGWSAGFETGYVFSRQRAIHFGFGITFPLLTMQIPVGEIEEGNRANMDLRYHHDFSGVTGIFGVEIQGYNYIYGGGNRLDFSGGGLVLGVMF